MTTFNWVVERTKCSAQQVFKELELGVKEDADTMNSQRPPHAHYKFTVCQLAGGRFSVIREEPRGIPSVEFVLEGNQIRVSINDVVKFTATLTLNNEGQCRLKVKDAELEQWQFRRMALEDLFFGHA